MRTTAIKAPAMAAALRRSTAPLGARDFRIFWFGQAVSAMGDPLQTIALVWLVLALGHSAAILSTMLIAITVPRSAATLVGGVLTDRWTPRRVMLGADLVRGSMVALMVLLALGTSLSLGALATLLILFGIAAGLFTPATATMTPRLVPADQIPAATALTQMTPQVALLLGAPLAGGLVATWGPIPALALNAGSFLVAAVTVACLPSSPPIRPGSSPVSLRREVVDGVRAVGRLGWLRALLLIDGVLTLASVGPFTLGLPLLACNVLGNGASGYGWLLAGFGAGSLAGMLVLAGAPQLRRPGLVFCLLHLVQAPLLALMVLPAFPLVLVAVTTIGLLHGIGSVLYLTLIQTRVAPALMGRVMSMAALSATAFVALSQALTGLLSDRIGVEMVFVTAAALTLTGALGGLFVPALRRLDARSGMVDEYVSPSFAHQESTPQASRGGPRS